MSINYKKKIEEDLDCGIRVSMIIFGGKWKLCILDAINRGVTRPAEIKKQFAGAPIRVIEMQLAELLLYGVVQKVTEECYPKRTEYSLTAMGASILPLLEQINEWGSQHIDLVKSKQPEPANFPSEIQCGLKKVS